MARTSGRPREFDEEEALDAIMELFWDRGYAATSMMDLVEATGVQKASLYAAFGDKLTIYRLVLRRYVERLVAETVETLTSSGRIRERFARFLRAAVARAASGNRMGCFLVNASTDGGSDDTELLRDIRRGLLDLEGVVAEFLAPVFPERSARNIRSHQILGAYVAIQSLARSGYSSSAMEAVMMDAVGAIPNRAAT